MREVLTTPAETGAPHGGRRRAALAVAALLGVLALVGWAVVAHRPSPSDRTTETSDSRATIHDVSFDLSDTAYVVESVDAVVQGGEGFLRLRIRWVDDLEDASSGQAVPPLSATVTHAEPYAGLTATCGTDAAVGRGPDVTLELRLPCQGLLVPEDVATVELRD